jgi:tRNA A58 N-methylase Trm61
MKLINEGAQKTFNQALEIMKKQYEVIEQATKPRETIMHTVK